MPLRRRIAFFLSLSINTTLLISATYFVHQKGGLFYVRQKICRLMKSSKDRCALQNASWHSRFTEFVNLPNDPEDIYFVGDSIIAAGEWHELLDNPHCKNRGISGDTTQGILLRLGEIIDGQPSAIVLKCGINNLQKGESVGRITRDYETIVERIVTGTRRSRLYLQSILPINDALYRDYIAPRHPGIHAPTRMDVLELNKALSRIADDHERVFYIALDDLCDESGQLADCFTLDGLHLNGDGLRQWADIMSRILAERNQKGA